MASRRSILCIKVREHAIFNCAVVRDGRLTEKADIHETGYAKPALRIYQVQFPHRKMPDNRNCQWLHRRRTRSLAIPISLFIESRLLLIETSEESFLCDSR